MDFLSQHLGTIITAFASAVSFFLLGRFQYKAKKSEAGATVKESAVSGDRALINAIDEMKINISELSLQQLEQARINNRNTIAFHRMWILCEALKSGDSKCSDAMDGIMKILEGLNPKSKDGK